MSTSDTSANLPPDTPIEAGQHGTDSGKKRYKWFLLIVLVYAILVAVNVIGNGFKLATGEHARSLFEFAENPVLGLVIGMTATALIQSSSTVTSIIVAMVAGGLPIGIAIPMVMGANIGTSITNTIVSLGHVAEKREFQRAFSAATIHDFFNIICVLIFLPLEVATGFLQHLSAYVVDAVTFTTVSGSGFNPIKAATSPIAYGLQDTLAFLPNVAAGIVMALVGVGLIIMSITFMGKTMKALMVGKAKEILHNAIGRGPVSGISSGTLVTVLVQSSSTTTSLVVPLVGNGLLQTRDIYPFTLGANIGTCITALIAAMSITGPNAQVALQIALVHLMYNIMGVLVVFGIKYLREIPPYLSHALSVRVAEHKLLGLGYIFGVFFLIPMCAIFLSV